MKLFDFSPHKEYNIFFNIIERKKHITIMKKLAVALLSGGLDSTLAVKLMIDQGFEVHALNFISSFCTCNAGGSTQKDKEKHGHKHEGGGGCRSEAKRVAAEFDIPITVKIKGLEYIDIVRNPKHGYGQGINPCIDCRIFMFKQAKEFMHEIGASCIITGEVLGQRPMSQRMDAMALTDRESDLTGYVLRPLCAHHMDPTIVEKEGLVDRDKLLAIQGRSRREQMDLADEMGLEDYPCPSGGCLLTDKIFAKKVHDLFDYKKDITMKDLNQLKAGRHLRMDDGLKIIVGRDEHENRALKHLLQEGETLVTPNNFPGPSAIVQKIMTEEDYDLIGSIIIKYSGKADEIATFDAKTKEKEFVFSIKNNNPIAEEIVREASVC